MDKQKSIAWIKSAAVAALGGGIAGAFAAAMDPTKYSIEHDIGSGKLWKFFGMGALLTFGGMLMRSPLGQSAMQAYRESQQQLEQDRADLDAAKAALRHPTSQKETTTMSDKPTTPAPPPTTPPAEPPQPPQK